MAVTRGACFQMPRHFRIAAVWDRETMQEGLIRLESALAEASRAPSAELAGQRFLIPDCPDRCRQIDDDRSRTSSAGEVSPRTTRPIRRLDSFDSRGERTPGTGFRFDRSLTTISDTGRNSPTGMSVDRVVDQMDRDPVRSLEPIDIDAYGFGSVHRKKGFSVRDSIARSMRISAEGMRDSPTKMPMASGKYATLPRP